MARSERSWPAQNARQQHRPHAAIALDPIERRGEPRVHRRGEGVELVGTVQREARHAAVDVEENRRFGHPSHSSGRSARNGSTGPAARRESDGGGGELG
jgi:hypothetical protein